MSTQPINTTTVAMEPGERPLVIEQTIVDYVLAEFAKDFPDKAHTTPEDLGEYAKKKLADRYIQRITPADRNVIVMLDNGVSLLVLPVPPGREESVKASVGVVNITR